MTTSLLVVGTGIGPGNAGGVGLIAGVGVLGGQGVGHPGGPQVGTLDGLFTA